jgi:hypothetical protein
MDSFGGGVPLPSGLLVPQPFTNSIEGGYILEISLASYGIQCCSTPSIGALVGQNQTYNLVDSLSWLTGPHVFKFGVDYRRVLPYASNGSYQSGAVISSASGITQGFLDYLFVNANQPAYLLFNNVSLYAQDHWKLSSRLTLDLGLRWEVNPSPESRKGPLPLAVNEISDLASTAFEPQGTQLYKTRFDNLAPRVGFAYAIRTSARFPLVMRGGGGIFFDTGQSQAASGAAGYPFSASSPLYSQVPLPFPSSDLAPPAIGGPLVPPYGFLTGIIDPRLRLPYTEQWNLSLDQSFGGSSTFTASYVGNAGHRLIALHSYYLAAVNPDFASVNIADNEGGSSYEALQLQYNGRPSPSLNVIASYSLAHARDNQSTDASYNLFPPIWGNSDNDIRHSFNLALNWQGPTQVTSRRLLGATARNWLFSARFFAQSGLPSSIIANYYNDPLNGQLIPVLALLVPGVPLYRHDVPGVPGSWELNPGAFVAPPVDSNGIPLVQGPRNYVHGPNFWSLNTAVQRDLHLSEKLRLVMRVEAFNLLNHPNFGTINKSLLDGSQFGQLYGAQSTIGVNNGSTINLYGTGNPRSLQLALKLQF